MEKDKLYTREEVNLEVYCALEQAYLIADDGNLSQKDVVKYIRNLRDFYGKK